MIYDAANAQLQRTEALAACRKDLADEFFPCSLFPFWSEQISAVGDCVPEPFEKCGIGFGPDQEARQRIGVPKREIAWIIAAQQPDGPVYARSQHWNACRDSF